MRSSRGRSKTDKSSSISSEKEISKRSLLHQENGFEEWGGYYNAKKQKLNDQFNTEDKGSNIFKGVAVYINGYTKPSSDELRRLLTEHGGRFEQYLYKRRVTHIVATNLPNSKIHSLKAMKVVRPEWITESVQSGKLLPYTSYLLYGAATNQMTTFGESVKHSTRLPLPSATSETNHSVTEQPTSTVFKSKTSDNFSEQQTSTFSNLKPFHTLNYSENQDSDEEFLFPDEETNSKLSSASVEANVFSARDGTILLNCDTDHSPTDQKSNPNLSSSSLQDIHENIYLAGIGVNIKLPSLTDKEINSKRTPSLHDGVIQYGDENSSPTDEETNSKRSPSLHDSDIEHSDENSSPTHEETNPEPPRSSHRSEFQVVDHKNTVRSSTARPSTTASDPGFVAEFYSHSRLHHISTSGAQFKEYVSRLQKQSDGVFPGREKLRQYHLKRLARTASVDELGESVRGRPDKIIMHVDMDCFFVSVGLRERPDLVGKPVAVTHSKGKEGPGTGREQTHLGGTTQPIHKFSSMAEIASCSYEARKAGVKNGMFMGPALKLCPNLTPIPYEFDKYQQVSETLYDTVASYTHDIEAVSCDEMLIDCTYLLADTGVTALDFASVLREEIKIKTGCNASAGIASSILLARLATRSAKPNGQFHLEPCQIADFMVKQSVKDLPGVGWSMARKLTSLNIKTCADLQKVSLATLQKEFGLKTGENFYKFSRGEDNRQIKVEKERKSVSAEINYGIRFQKESEAVKFVSELAEEVCNRLKQINKKGKTITLKLMIRRTDAPKEAPKYLGHGKCTHVSKSTTLPISTNDVTMISKECVSILKSQRIDMTDIRGVGIQINRLESCSVGTQSARDNQSILGFTVVQKPGLLVKPTSSTMTIPSFTHTPSSPEYVNRTEETDNLIGSYKRIDQSDNLLDDGLGNDIMEEDPSLVDTGSTSFHCSNSTIQEELFRRKNAKLIAPPLPTLPDMFVSPETTKSKSVESEDYFPSPSQIDPEVLKELPADIRIQIEKEMNMRRSRRNPATKTHKKTTASSQEAGCSHWSGQPADPTNQKTVLSEKPRPSLNDKESKNIDFDPLPSPSQLDMSCLNALPEEMQKEIRMGYAKQNKVIADPMNIHTPGVFQLQPASPSKQKPTKKASPHKTASPSKGSRKSPIFKVPRSRRGRKKKLSAKKLEFKEKTINVEQEKIEENGGEDIADILPSASTHNAAVQDITHHVDEEVNLCGAVTIGQVRILLAEWLESSPVPQDDDLTAMMTYLGQLVENKNLEMVDLVLKCLHRKIQKLVNMLWKTTFNKILNSTQDVVFAYYGCCLKTDWLTRY